jgi:hypothetical protein
MVPQRPISITEDPEVHYASIKLRGNRLFYLVLVCLLLQVALRVPAGAPVFLRTLWAKVPPRGISADMVEFAIH